jgi:translation initiation factor 5
MRISRKTQVKFHTLSKILVPIDHSLSMPPKKGLIPLLRDADEHYRYKMTPIAATQRSSGNGVKTAVLNADTIARAIYRSSTCLIQWFSYALAAQSKAGQSTEQIVLNGKHSPADLQNSIYEFIDTFVLCPTCHNPETEIEIRTDAGQKLFLHCNSCGNSSPVQTRPGSAATKMAEWFISHTTPKKGPADVPKQANVAREAPAKGRLDELDDYHAAANLSEVDASSVISLQADLPRLQELAKDTGPVQSPEMMGAYLEQYLLTFKRDIVGYLSDACIWNEFKRVTDVSKMSESGARVMLIDALFDSVPPDEVLKLIEKRRGLLILASQTEAHQLLILLGILRWVNPGHLSWKTSIPILFHAFFDNEIISEQVFKNWNAKVQKSERNKEVAAEFRELAKPFLAWLDTAEFEPEMVEVGPDDDAGSTGDRAEEEDEPQVINEAAIDDI